MKGAVLALLAVTLAALMAPPAAAQDIWQEQRISGDGAHVSGYAKLSQGNMYWIDTRTYQLGYSEVRTWDSVNGERVQRHVEYGELLEDVCGQRQITRRYSSAGGFDLYLWDAMSGERVVTTAPGDQSNARTNGEYVVWEDHRGTYSQIYLWDPVNGERALYPSSSNQVRPRISNSRVTWTAGGSTYMWTPAQGVTQFYDQSTGGAVYSAVYQDRVVIWKNAWTEYPPGLPAESHPGFLKEWTPQNGLRTILQHDKTTSALETWGDLIVGSGFVWDPEGGFTSLPVPNPSVYGNQIATKHNDDGHVYLYTMVPEPSSLLALATGIGTLGMMLRRRAARSG